MRPEEKLNAYRRSKSNEGEVKGRRKVGAVRFRRLQRSDPYRHGNEERAHANQRNDVLKQIGHYSLLFSVCLHFVLLLFDLSRMAIQSPDTRGGEG